MNRLILILCGFLLTASSVSAKNARLFGVIGNALYSVDHETAATKKIVDIRVPQGVMMRDLTYHDNEQVFFSFTHFMTAPRLVCFSWDGSFKDIGPININGHPVSMIEAIDYNEADGHVYASVSTDGVDKYSETIVRVNIETAACTIVGTLNAIGRDADDIAFWTGKLYVSDGIPRSDVSIIHACRMPEADQRGFASKIVKRAPYRRISDLAAMNGYLYGTDEKYRLVRYALDGKDAVLIGKTHTPNPDLREKRMLGLATVKMTFAK